MPAEDVARNNTKLVILAESGGLPLAFRAVIRWSRVLRKLHLRAADSRLLATLSLMSLPLLLLAIRHWPYRPLSAFWAVWLTLCDSLIILLSWHTWDSFMAARETVNDLLRDASNEEVSKLEMWYRSALKATPQATVCACISGLTLWAALRLPSPVVERVPVAIVSLVLSGFIAGHAAYFIICTAIFCRRIALMSGLSLRWSDPINTPGLVALSRAVQLEALMGIVLFFVTAAPLTYAYVRVHNVSTRALYICAMIIPLACILVIGVVIQTWLAVPAQAAKAQTLEELAASIEKARGGRDLSLMNASDLGTVRSHIEMYQLLSGCGESFFSGGVVTQYLASIGAATVPFVIAFLLR